MNPIRHFRVRSLSLGAAALVSCLPFSMEAAAASPAGGSGSTAPVYKWVDANGTVHYGDSVPAEYAQTERSVLNDQGVEVGHVAGQKSAEEQAAAAQAAEAARRRAQHDQFLLSTYVSTKDIERLRDERLEQTDGQIKASSAYVDTLSARLAVLQDRAGHFKPYSSDPNAQRMPDDLAEELVRTLNEARSQRQALEIKRREQADMRAQFEADIQRYRELTAAPHS
jgi:hypothetical protein